MTKEKKNHELGWYQEEADAILDTKIVQW